MVGVSLYVVQGSRFFSHLDTCHPATLPPLPKRGAIIAQERAIRLSMGEVRLPGRENSLWEREIGFREREDGLAERENGLQERAIGLEKGAATKKQ